MVPLISHLALPNFMSRSCKSWSHPCCLHHAKFISALWWTFWSSSMVQTLLCKRSCEWFFVSPSQKACETYPELVSWHWRRPSSFLSGCWCWWSCCYCTSDGPLRFHSSGLSPPYSSEHKCTSNKAPCQPKPSRSSSCAMSLHCPSTWNTSPCVLVWRLPSSLLKLADTPSEGGDHWIQLGQWWPPSVPRQVSPLGHTLTWRSLTLNKKKMMMLVWV